LPNQLNHYTSSFQIIGKEIIVTKEIIKSHTYNSHFIIFHQNKHHHLKSPTVQVSQKITKHHQVHNSPSSPMHINHQGSPITYSPRHLFDYDTTHQLTNGCNVLDSSRCMWYHWIPEIILSYWIHTHVRVHIHLCISPM